MINNKSIPLLIKGGHIIDPGQDLDQVADLLISRGEVTQLGGAITTTGAGQHEVIDATGLVLSPGFTDIHCHLREPGFADKETIATGTKAAAKGGFATVCCMANTNPPLDNRDILDWVKRKAKEDGSVDVFPIGCITRQREGKEVCNMEELAEAGVVAFSDDGDSVADSQVMRRAMDCSRDLGLPIIEHCEDKALSDGGAINEGRVSAMLGLKGIPAAAEEVILARDLILAKLTGTKFHVAHVSTCGSVELIRQAKDKGVSVTAEVTPHHLTLTEDRILRKDGLDYDTNAKVNPPLRTEEDIECLIRALNDGVIDAIATDHAPHSSKDKDFGLALAAFGISGFETAFGCLMGLVHEGRISLNTLISKLTHDPAKIIGKDAELGTLRLGAPANITIFDPNQEWVVSSRNFVSKGKNTPYDGYKFKGKVMATIVNGRIAYLDDSLATLSRTVLPLSLKGES
jgi:dihydroorotase